MFKNQLLYMDKNLL